MTTSILMPSPVPRAPPPPTTTTTLTPPLSPSSRATAGMQIDLSTLPGLVLPTPPSNTLLITNLTNSAIFLPSSLLAIRIHLESVVGDASLIHAFSPLKSLRRIIVSFTTTDAAILVRRDLDGVELMGCRARLYFGEPTPIENTAKLLQAPASEKQFFISPPPSPPHGWTMRNEDPPNKEVHPADLVNALARLDARRHGDEMMEVEGGKLKAVETVEDPEMVDVDERNSQPPRRKSSTTVVYQPEVHGGSPGLPAVLVEDVSEEGEPLLETDRRILEHTSRPPVELME